MKYIRFKQNGIEKYGVLNNDKITVIDGDLFSEYSVSDDIVYINDVKILTPCKPTKIVAVGLNYADHANEMGDDLPEFPALFLKPSTAVIGYGDPIVIPEMAGRVDYEAELAIVIKKTAKNISAQQAKDYVMGYTCLNDVTARDLQKVDSQWMRAKSFDTFAPLGPVIETYIDPDSANICARLNGKIVQQSNTSNFIFKTEYLISTISQIMTLNPGDVITTGTPAGIGELHGGDCIEIEIDGIGILKNTVTEEGQL